MANKIISYFRRVSLTKFDRWLFLGVILSHIAGISESVRHFALRFASEEIIAVVYIILITIFWSYYIISYTQNEVATRDQKIEEQNGLTENLYKEIKSLSRIAKYAYAYQEIGLGFSRIHQIQRLTIGLEKSSPNLENQLAVIVSHFESLCTHLARGFQDIHGSSNISVCIKLINGKNVSNNSTVKTLTRDDKNPGREYFENGNMHPISDNTSFSTILKSAKPGIPGRCFSDNCLPLRRGYRNTSMSIYNQEVYSDELPDEERLKRWVMPYRSTIVTGIYPNIKGYTKKEKNLIGFLCIDAPESGVFINEIDEQILTGVADGIYNSLKTLKKLI